MTEQQDRPRLLEGIRVLDLSRIIAGPFCSQILGDMGAEIIKIEQPGLGDDSRTWGPPFKQGESVYFFSINRNKKSVTVDMKHPRGKTIIRDLAKRSDILLENFKPGTLAKLGLDWEDLRGDNPRLIFCSISGFGRTGPSAERGGYDVIVQAVGGLMSITGNPDGPPVKVGVAMTDICTALYAHGAILAALYARDRTGEGQRIDLSLLETQIAALINIASSYLNAGEIPGKWGTAHVNIVPYQAFKMQDGYMVIGAANDRLWVKLCEAIGLPEVGRNPKYAANAQRVEHREEIIHLLENRLITKTRREWEAILAPLGIPCGPINRMDEVFSDEHVRHLQMVLESTHPQVGMIRMVRNPVTFSRTPLDLRQAPPKLGEHTEEVLRGILGCSAAELEDLRAAGVI
ncbi:MAG TPA: CaiB/BaiF CoA-transferase family protein [Candidatus Acidoferrum sp.]|nr:CaiB/BaiF CoA-transferase family protein [Candidatus Acidoferrum sp.]